ncbi:hypothetical protein B0A52_08236 [Exophiala mesophila]|uniref:Aminoglycoside phosphotransferase domain-containing protein n=1 Tax=Exophiala mesophila TaxID=212818 RepID=A0A438MWG3_EXOME|nr:hypothetical protein B0A52_08236 [Exophiala mesophila]
MESHAPWTQEKLDSAFEEQSKKEPSAIFLNSFGRRVFRYEGRIIKYGEPVDLHEAQALAFVKQSGLNIPVPQLYSSSSSGEIKVIEMQVIEGDTLDKVWDGLTEQERLSYAQQLRQIVTQLHSLEGDYISSLERGPAVDARRDRNYGGPFVDEAEFNTFLLSNTISTTPDIYRKLLESLLSHRTHRIVFTHGDLSPSNIIVKGGLIVGIIDWENAGWYPEYWESLQFFRGMYRGYRDYADVIFEVLHPVAVVTDHFLGHLTRH